jgi:dolichol-phosphate mannosyltransferase
MSIQDEISRRMKQLAEREQARDRYWTKRDPILHDRLLWRAQTFRHMVHLLPGQSVLELGCGQGLFTRQLVSVSRGENPITAVTFDAANEPPVKLPDAVEFVHLASEPNALEGRQFDFVVVMELLDAENCATLLQDIYEYLKPGGQILFYQTNPWNPVLKARQTVGKLFGKKPTQRLLSRPALYELISELGFIRVFAVFNDFVYAPLNRPMIWVLRNLSIMLENAPGVQTMAGTILIHAQKPPRVIERPKVRMCEHKSLHNAVSVVVPCHNEEMNIGPLVNRLRELYDDYIYEIIPVDDNSRDRTAEVLRELAAEDPRVKPVFRTPPNGVGRAIADGYRHATGKYVLSMDSDFQHLLPELRDLFDAAAEGYDVAVGSRFSRHSVLLNYPIQKIVANRGFHALAQILLFRHFRDMTNNLKLMRQEVKNDLELTQPHFSVNAETGLKPLLMGYSVKEVPISWINRTPDMGISSFKLAKVGGGYGHVLMTLWRAKMAGKLKQVNRRGVPPTPPDPPAAE